MVDGCETVFTLILKGYVGENTPDVGMSTEIDCSLISQRC
jgi:hypothetical protein